MQEDTLILTNPTTALTRRIRGGSAIPTGDGSANAPLFKGLGIEAYFIFILVFFLSTLVIHASAKSRPEMKRVYIFGFSASFSDSLACITPVQELDSAWVDGTHGFLMDRALYSLQLQYYVEQAYGVKNNTCTVFFSRGKRKAERLQQKLCRRYEKDKGVKFKKVGNNEFAFKAENYLENAPVQIEQGAAATQQGQQQPPK